MAEAAVGHQLIHNILSVMVEIVVLIVLLLKLVAANKVLHKMAVAVT